MTRLSPNRASSLRGLKRPKNEKNNRGALAAENRVFARDMGVGNSEYIHSSQEEVEAIPLF